MAYTQPTVPNVTDYITFLQNELSIPATALPYPLGSPATPALAAASGGSLPSGTIYVKITYVSAYGESTPSTEASVPVASNDKVTVTGPSAVPNATGWNVYAALATGVEVLQNATPIAIATTSYVISSLTTGTASPPTTDTTLSPWIGYALASSQNLTLPIYTVAAQDYVNVVYCGAAHTQLFITPDIPTGNGFFAAQRASFHMMSFTTGLVSNASDQGTSSTTVVPESMKRLTFQDLQFMTTPWGRLWLGWGQDYGTPWGIS